MSQRKVSHSRVPNTIRFTPPHPLHSNSTGKHSAHSHFLSALLQVDPDHSESRLWRLAQQMSSRPVDLGRFRADVLTKLRRVAYSQPRDPHRRKYTFYDRIKTAGILPVFLCKSTLRGISEWLMLRDIVRTDRELEDKRLSVERHPLRFHSSMTLELSRHERAVTALMLKHRVEKQWAEEYLSAVGREGMRQLRILCLSRWPGSRESLLGKYRHEEVAAEVGIFDLLKGCVGHALSDRFLRRLAQLVCAPLDAREISNERDEALRRALERR